MKQFIALLSLFFFGMMFQSCSDNSAKENSPLASSRKLKIDAVNTSIDNSRSNFSGISYAFTVAVNPKSRAKHTDVINLIGAAVKNPDGSTVVRDLSFYDDGTNGDKVASDNVYTCSYQFDNVSKSDKQRVMKTAADVSDKLVEISCDFQFSWPGESGKCGTCGGTSILGGKTIVCVGVCNCSGISFGF